MTKLTNIFNIMLSSILLSSTCVYASDIEKLSEAFAKMMIFGWVGSLISLIFKILIILLVFRWFFLWYFKINRNIELLYEIRDLLKKNLAGEKNSSVQNFETLSLSLKNEPINDDRRFMPPEMR